MALATVFRRNDGEGGWRLSLTGRILAVNIFALIVLAGGFFYLDSYRVQLLEERTDEISTEAKLAATAAAGAPSDQVNALLEKLGEASGYRFRLYQGRGAPIDSWSNGKPSYVLRDPNDEPWKRHVARFMDRFIDHVVGAEVPEPFVEPDVDRLSAWPEAIEAAKTGNVQTAIRRAPARTPVISAAMPVGGRNPGVLLLTSDQRDVIHTVRAERFWKIPEFERMPSHDFR